MASSAFYAGGIAEQAIGRAAPWFIFGVMLFSYAVRAVYVESCAMFTRGGVYRVVKEAMGGTLAKLSVSALMFDYVLTGPISAVSAGQYIIGLVAQTVTYFGHPWRDKDTVNLIAAGIAVFITVYFWWRNTRGIHESSGDALRIMYVTTAMAIIMIVWSSVTILTQPDKQRLPPLPIPSNLSFNTDAVGWLPHIAPRSFPNPEERGATRGFDLRHRNPGGVEIRPGPKGRDAARADRDSHRLRPLGPRHVGRGIAGAGEPGAGISETQNLMRAGMVIFVYSLLFTSLVSFFAYAIIPDTVRPQYFDNLISGITMNGGRPCSRLSCSSRALWWS